MFCSTIPTEKCDFEMVEAKKFRLANSHYKIMKTFLGGLYMLKKLFTFGFDHITLHSSKNQLFTLVVASKIPLFGTPKGFQKVFHSTIPTEKCDSGMVEAKKI